MAGDNELYLLMTRVVRLWFTRPGSIGKLLLLDFLHPLCKHYGACKPPYTLVSVHIHSKWSSWNYLYSRPSLGKVDSMLRSKYFENKFAWSLVIISWSLHKFEEVCGGKGAKLSMPRLLLIHFITGEYHDRSLCPVVAIFFYASNTLCVVLWDGMVQIWSMRFIV